MRCGASTDMTTSCTAWKQRVGDTVKKDSAFDLTRLQLLLLGGGGLIVNLFSGRLVALTQRLLTRWFTGQDRGGASPPPPDPDCRAQTAGPSEHQAGQTHCQWRQREDEERELPGYDSIVQWLWDKTIIIPILSPPSNYPPTLIPTILKCWLLKPARRLVHRQHRQHRQLFRETLTDSVQYTYVCKQNAQGTNAWLWYMCNRVVLLYSYSMNLVFLLVAFNFRKKKKKKKSGCQASVCLFFFLKIFLSTVLKYVQLNWMYNWFKYERISLTSLRLKVFLCQSLPFPWRCL